MCISPNNLPEIGPVACHKCWQCRANRVNDLVGRCIAEQKNSYATYAVTLTYAGNHPNSATLVYADFQRFMKRLRKTYDVRYIVAGEYGSKRGRAHWHCILFFNGDAPTLHELESQRKTNDDVVLDRRIDWTPWPHGFSFFQQTDYNGFRYILKYVLKDQKDARTSSHLAMSKLPPLGHNYFQELADRHVQEGLAPQNYNYSFPDVYDSKRKRRSFFLSGKSRENFLNAFLSKWENLKGTPHPLSEVLDLHLDKMTDLEAHYTDEDWAKRLNYKPVRYASPDRSPEPPMVSGVKRIGTYEGIPVTLIELDGSNPILEMEDQSWPVHDPAQIEQIRRGFREISREIIQPL